MAREKFFLDQEEDTIHANQIELKTAKDKRANWWYYHKVHLLVAILAVGVVGSIIYSLVSKVYPDYTIALLTQDTYSSDVTDRLAEQLEAYADDRNHDGQVIVQVSTYAIGTDSNDMQVQQANQVRFIGDATSFESVIFLTDEESFEWLQTQEGGFFSYIDGTTPEEGSTDYENMRIPWTDCKALSQMDLSIDMLDKEQAQKYMSGLAVSTRVIAGSSFEKNSEKASYYEESQALLQRLLSDQKLTEEEQFKAE